MWRSAGRSPRPPAGARLACVVLGGALVAPGPARAASDDASLPFALTYAAPAACIDAASFRARLLSLPVAPGATPPRAPSLVLTIEEKDGRFVGVLRVTHADGGSMERTVASGRCDEVSDALEIIAAVALGLRAPPPRSPQVASPSPSLPLASPPQPPSLPRSRARWRFMGALRAGLVSGAGPDLEVTPSVALGLTLDRDGLLAPSFEIEGAWATSGNVVTSNGVAVITQWAGGAAACPLRVAMGSSFVLRPCLEVMAGVLSGSASGTNVAPGPADVAPWLSLAPLARAEWRWNDVLSMEIEGGPAFELLRDRFFFRPTGTTVYSVPTAGAVGRLGVVVRWP